MTPIARLIAAAGTIAVLLAACAPPPRVSAPLAVPEARKGVLIKPSETRTIGRTTVNRTAAVRRAPSHSAPRVAILAPGTTVRFYGHQGGWTLIRLSTGRGWVQSSLLGLRRARAVKRPGGLRDVLRGGGRPAAAPDPAGDAIAVERCKTPADCPNEGGAVVVPDDS